MGIFLNLIECTSEYFNSTGTTHYHLYSAYTEIEKILNSVCQRNYVFLHMIVR